MALKVLILGVDGYLGWPLAGYLANRGHEVSGVDNLSRRRWVDEMGSTSATPIASLETRRQAFQERWGRELPVFEGDLTDVPFTYEVVETVRPDCIVHLAEMPSAPYSMIDAEHAAYTHHNNLIGTLNLLFAMRDLVPDCHLQKLGTMGEYGTPNVEIPEGLFDLEFRGRKDRALFPRDPGSFYHCTKVHDTINIRFACKTWGLRSSDIMQGVVFGTHSDETEGDERLLTRFDFDEAFGTCINRYCASAVIGEPLTVYGTGGQKRGFLPLRDSLQCFGLSIESPPERGEYRSMNQFADVFSVRELAEKVARVAKERVGIDCRIEGTENPRVEKERHYYLPERRRLVELGYEPTESIDSVLEETMRRLSVYRDRILARADRLRPKIRWADGRDGRKRGTPVERDGVPGSPG